MATTDLSPFGVQAGEIEHRRLMAQLLSQQGNEPLQTNRTAGGFVVPISPFEGLAKVLQSGLGAYGQRRAGEEMKSLAGKQQADRGADMESLVKALQGAPAQPEQWKSEGLDALYQPATEARAPGTIDPAMISALRLPETQNIALGMFSKQMEREAAPPTRVDLGDKIGLFNSRGQMVGSLPKGATPDAQLRNQTTMQTHQTPSGSAILQNEGANQRHILPSGSAQLGAQTTLQTHATPSGSAQLQAATARRGQDMGIDPAIQGRLAEVRAGGKERGEAQAQAQINLPQAAAKAQQALELVDQMVGSTDRTVKRHPGFNTAVGATATPGLRFIEGTDTASFMKLLDQVKGGAFLQAFEALKGGGAITEVEGQKATSAITRMDKAQSEAEFVKAAREFQETISAGLDRMKQRAGQQASPSGFRVLGKE